MQNPSVIPLERIESKILLIRGKKVILDRDLAELYQVTTKALNQSVRRNVERFPQDFMFQLTIEEFENLKSQIVISSLALDLDKKFDSSVLRSQFVTSKDHLTLDTKSSFKNLRSQSVTANSDTMRRFLPFAFTEQGIAMLSSVLRSKRAVMVNIQIMRTFTQLRELLASHDELRLKLEALEQRYDQQFKIVFDAIRQIMTPPEEPRQEIGFRDKTE